MPRLRAYRCKSGQPPHDEAVACVNCWELVCGYHAERSAEDDELLCPLCAEAERRRVADAGRGDADA